MNVLCCCGGGVSHNVEKFGSTDSGTAPSSLWIYQAGPVPTNTEGIRTDDDGNSYVMWYSSTASSYKVDVIDSSGSNVTTFSVDKVKSSDVASGGDVQGGWDVDGSGNVYTAAKSGTTDIVLKKYDNTGSLQWTSSALVCANINTMDNVHVSCEKTETAGICVLTSSGSANDTVDNDVHYLDTSGSLQWDEISVTGFGSANQPLGAAVVDDTENVIVACHITYALFYFIRSYDSTGATNWTSSDGLTHSTLHSLQPLAIDSSSDIYIVNNAQITGPEFTVFDGGTGAENQNFTYSGSGTPVRATRNSATNWIWSDGTKIRNHTVSGTNRWTIDDGWPYVWNGPSDQLWCTGGQK